MVSGAHRIARKAGNKESTGAGRPEAEEDHLTGIGWSDPPSHPKPTTAQIIASGICNLVLLFFVVFLWCLPS